MPRESSVSAIEAGKIGQGESSEDWYNQGELPGGGDTSRWVLKDGRTPLSEEDKSEF